MAKLWAYTYCFKQACRLESVSDEVLKAKDYYHTPSSDMKNYAASYIKKSYSNKPCEYQLLSMYSINNVGFFDIVNRILLDGETFYGFICCYFYLSSMIDLYRLIRDWNKTELVPVQE